MEPSTPRHHRRSNRPDMEISIDRGRRLRTTLGFWLILLAVAGLLALLLMRFTGSKLIAFGLAGGMLLYMLIAAAITSRNLSKAPGDGRLD